MFTDPMLASFLANILYWINSTNKPIQKQLEPINTRINSFDWTDEDYLRQSSSWVALSNIANAFNQYSPLRYYLVAWNERQLFLRSTKSRSITDPIIEHTWELNARGVLALTYYTCRAAGKNKPVLSYWCNSYGVKYDRWERVDFRAGWRREIVVTDVEGDNRDKEVVLRYTSPDKQDCRFSFCTQLDKAKMVNEAIVTVGDSGESELLEPRFPMTSHWSLGGAINANHYQAAFAGELGKLLSQSTGKEIREWMTTLTGVIQRNWDVITDDTNDPLALVPWI